MGDIGKPERETQNHVIALFRDTLGYRYLGDKSDCENHNVEEPLLRSWLAKRDYGEAQVNRALDVLGDGLRYVGLASDDTRCRLDASRVGSAIHREEFIHVVDEAEVVVAVP